MPDADFVPKIKRLTIKALFSDDSLLHRLVLKGGNLLDVVYDLSARASADLDFSVDGDLGPAVELQRRIEFCLKSAFADVQFEVFDVNVLEKPDKLSDDMKPFWGGYQIDFKIIETRLFRKFAGNLEQLRRNAASVGQRGSTRFEIDISKHEYCEPKQSAQLDFLTIYAYTPLMIVCEKLRAICQQMPEYTRKMHNHASARARDFVDIHSIAQRYPIDVGGNEILTLLPKIFAAKRVPLSLLHRIPGQREFHRPDFTAVKATVHPQFALQEFDFYYDFVTQLVADGLKTLGNE